jgi:hypothetical protein
MALPPKPLMGWGVIGRKDLKSERKGEIWQEAPVSMMKGSEGEGADEPVDEETKKADGEQGEKEELEDAKQTR